MVTLPCRGRRGVPVEFMETVETSNGSSHHQISLEQEGGGTVLLDPVCDSSLAIRKDDQRFYLC